MSEALLDSGYYIAIVNQYLTVNYTWCVTGRQADRQTDRQTDREAGRQTDRQADRQSKHCVHMHVAGYE